MEEREGGRRVGKEGRTDGRKGRCDNGGEVKEGEGCRGGKEG